MSVAHLLSVTNPRGKHKRRKTRSRSHARSKNSRRHVRRIHARNPHRVSRRRVHARSRHHNPRFDMKGIINGYLIPAGIGATGALALDVGLSYLPLPTTLQTGLPNAAVKVAGALALGYASGKVLGRERGKAVAAGALTVVAYNLLKGLVKQYAPSIPGLSGDYSDMQVGAFMNGPTGYNPAPMLQGTLGAYMDSNLRSLQRAQMGAFMNDGM